jgi:hypothetical protein
MQLAVFVRIARIASAMRNPMAINTPQIETVTRLHHPLPMHKCDTAGMNKCSRKKCRNFHFSDIKGRTNGQDELSCNYQWFIAFRLHTVVEKVVLFLTSLLFILGRFYPTAPFSLPAHLLPCASVPLPFSRPTCSQGALFRVDNMT